VPIFLENRGLLDRFRSGERNALAEVYRFYFQDVYRLAQYGFVTRQGVRANSLAREPDRLDFTQDVFVKAFAPSARSSYDGLRAYRPFLLQVARNLRIDQLRQAGRDPSLAPGASELNLDLDIDALIEKNAAWPEIRAAEPDLHWQRQLQEAACALEALAPDVQELARLRFTEELSQAEVAGRLGITRRRVRTLESRLFYAIRRHLARAGLGQEKK
jgi:RNA polymerase sigma factor (sigma-70 family)